jgi:type III restriction enzyme
MSKLKLKFESDQEHQVKAIESVVGLFEGMPQTDDSFKMAGDETIANVPPYMTLDENWLLGNVQHIQGLNNLPPSMLLDTDDGEMVEGASLDTWHYSRFTIEMETGTGKTYAYLRSIFELRKRYGFRKFIIVVPSIAIYEGVIKSIDIMREHFRSLYDNEVLHLTKYDGQQISKLRSFANSSFTEVMVITLDSFNKSSNVIFKASEKLPGEKLPINYIQETRPILILDESQNYLSAKAKAALRTLKPLFGVCYSATPKERSNLIYRLGPVDAFRKNLVKKIEVLGVTEDNLNNPQLQLALEAITKGYTPTAKIKVMVYSQGKPERKTIEVKAADNIFDKTRNEAHRGLVVETIDRRKNKITFTNQEILSFNEKASVTKKDIFRVQIEETVRYHLRKQDELKKKGIKALSLFFIDRVANYQDQKGIIRQLFVEAFEKHKGSSTHFKKIKVEDVHRGYFAQKKNKKGEVEIVETHVENEKKTNEDKILEKAAYELIMKDKERLMSLEEQVSFIFAHSALKEGWDSPNVFQICTLNDTVSESKKRQEIGRGLRLCVNQQGERVQEEGVNVLTVIANENYDQYVSGLQREYVESGDVGMPSPSRARPYTATRNNKIFKSKEFKEFWMKLCQRTNYEIKIDSEKIIDQCINKLNGTIFPEPKITVTRGSFIITEFKFELISTVLEYARIRISISDTGGGSSIIENNFTKNSDFPKMAKDDRLKGLKIVDIEGKGEDAIVYFGDGRTLTKHSPLIFSSEKGQQTDPRTVQETQFSYPVFNLIDRTIKETQLTRPTVLQIFQGIKKESKKNLLKNPEGFSEIFIREIRNILANHIADTIEYNLTKDSEDYQLEELFPVTKHFPQKELIEGTEHSIYDWVQIDSDVEKRFVAHKLQEDDKSGNILFYFKFPSAFKVSMPKIIQNYCPDWGVARIEEGGKTSIQLVRETKGTMVMDRLRFPNESRKIACAKKHFAKLGLRYRPIDDKILKWWEDEK